MLDRSQAAPQLLVHSSGTTRLLPDGDRVRYTVGRDGEADFALADPRVSWEHAQLRADGTMWVLEDLNSHDRAAPQKATAAARAARCPRRSLVILT